MELELRNIEKSFADKKVLRGVSLKTESGKAFGLLGRNGAGKTTSIRVLMNVFSADGGEVLIERQARKYAVRKGSRVLPHRTDSDVGYHRDGAAVL